MKDGADSDLSRWALLTMTQKVFLSITRSLDRMPREMREICCHLREEIERLVKNDEKMPLIALGGMPLAIRVISVQSC